MSRTAASLAIALALSVLVPSTASPGTPTADELVKRYDQVMSPRTFDGLAPAAQLSLAARAARAGWLERLTSRTHEGAGSPGLARPTSSLLTLTESC